MPLPDAACELFTALKDQYFEQNDDIDQRTRDEWQQRDLRPSSLFPKGMRSTLLESEQWGDSRGGKVYPAKPLAGIWATAPYLHNGSVPTMRHLLLPADQRPVTFPVGQLEYDPENLGYQLDLDQVPDREGIQPFTFDTRLSGNSNAGHEGHDYGTDLEEAERRDLLEYLKVLESSY